MVASWWSRAGAYVTDVAVLLVLATAVFLPLWAVSDDALLAAAIAWGGTDYLFRGLVYAPLLMRRPGACNGQTLGKQLVGIRAVRDDGQRFDYAAAVRREWLARTLLIHAAGTVVTGGVATLVDYLLPVFDEEGRSLHDRAARTTVRALERPRRPTLSSGG